MLISKRFTTKVLLFCGLVSLVVPFKLYAIELAEPSRTSTEYTINIAETVQGEWHHEATIRLFNALYQPLGINPIYVSYPTKRALKWVSEGVFDAEAARVDGLEKSFPGLLKVPEAVMNMSTAIFCQSKEKCTLSKTTLFAVKQGFIFGKELCESHELKCIDADGSQLVAKLLELVSYPSQDLLLSSYS